MVYEYLFLSDKKSVPPKDIVSLLSSSNYRENHVPRLQNWATYFERRLLRNSVRSDVTGWTCRHDRGKDVGRRTARSASEKEENTVSLAQLAGSAVKMEVIPQMSLFINFQQTLLREMYG